MRIGRFSFSTQSRGGAPRQATPWRLGIGNTAFAGLLVMILGSDSPAATWAVEWDPDDPIDRIGRVVLAAASGDSIIIGPGVYYEHMVLTDKSLTMIGRDGASATILDGSVSIDDRGGSILYATEAYFSELRLSGITFRNGTGSNGHMGLFGGGAIHIWNNGYSPPLEIRIDDCIFVDNRARVGVSGQGGAIAVYSGADLVIERCRFSGNYARWDGGAVYAFTRMTWITDCEFDLPTDVGGDSSALFQYGGTCVVQGCRFRSSGAGGYGGCLQIYAQSAYVYDCSFIATGGRHACGIDFGAPGGWGAGTIDHIFERNQLSTDTPASPNDEPTVWIGAERDAGVTSIKDNVFRGCNVWLGAFAGSAAVERNCFDSASRVSACMAAVSCNVSWPVAIDNCYGSGGWHSNLVADPLFCSDHPADFTVSAASPCLPENSDGCGRIGRLEQGCGTTRVQPTTWGRVKNLYRTR